MDSGVLYDRVSADYEVVSAVIVGNVVDGGVEKFLLCASAAISTCRDFFPQGVDLLSGSLAT